MRGLPFIRSTFIEPIFVIIDCSDAKINNLSGYAIGFACYFSRQANIYRTQETVFVISATYGSIAALIFAKKIMRKKKIVLSSSGGNPAMHFIRRLMVAFGEDNIDTIAARIAATCRTTPILAIISMTDNDLELKGNTADCIQVENRSLNIEAENILVTGTTLIIS